MTGSSSNYVDFILAQLKCAALRSKLLTCEIDSITTALNGNFVSVDDALAWAHDAGVDLSAPSTIIPSSTSAA